MLPVHERLAELYNISQKRKLTATEEAEQQQCMQVNAKYCWEMARLHNQSLLAAHTNDEQWQKEISSQLFELRFTGKTANHGN